MKPEIVNNQDSFSTLNPTTSVTLYLKPAFQCDQRLLRVTRLSLFFSFHSEFYYSKTSFIGTLIYRDLHVSGSRNLIYRNILFLLQPPLFVYSDIVTVSRCFICRSFIMSIFLHTFVCISIFIFHHETK